jgi:uncharacterized protein YdeI (YjbR/CyaY-like superfamily)
MSDVIGDMFNAAFDVTLGRAMGDASERTIKRPRQPMPDDVHAALTSRKLIDAYEARPPYQRNDYLGWIARAREPETQRKRLAIMLQELASGSGYMGQPYNAKRSRSAHRPIADKR